MELVETESFTTWLGGLRDTVGRRRIVARLLKLQATGHFGDVAPVGDGVSEMRFHFGPGYRVYFVVVGSTILLCGGDKGSQARDIAQAKAIAADYTGG